MKPKLQIWLELETRCNLRCQFCYNYWRGAPQDEPSQIATARLLPALDTLLDAADCSSITISGGEPLLRRDLFAILEHIHERGIPMVLTTNGTLLTSERVRALMNAGISTFQIPFLSPDATVHDALSGAECFRKTLRALIALKEAAANVLVVFVATRSNLRHFAGVMEVCAALGINEVIFNRFVPSGLGQKNREALGVPTEDELYEVLIDANRFAESKEMRIHLGVPIRSLSAGPGTLTRVTTTSCPVGLGQSRWTIGPDGNVRRCNDSEHAIGNLLSGAATMLLNERRSEMPALSNMDGFQPCRILNNKSLVQLR